MKSIVLVGHSMGGQMLARYAAVGDKKDTASRLVYWIGNPSSYT
jgi:triacylglycerol esterase/lipase EstA (alpha/beta hydrolase family)